MQQSSRPQRVYILRGVQRRCVWAVWRLGLAAWLTCIAAAPVAQAVPVRPLDALRRTLLSGGRADSIHTATPDKTKQSCLCRVWRRGVNWVSVFHTVSPSIPLESVVLVTRKLLTQRC